MKKFQFILVLISFMGLILIGCSDKSQSPVSPADQNSKASLDKKDPVVHYIKGANLGTYDGKNAGIRITAHEYADGSFDGEYEINAANAFKDPSGKWNGNVLNFKVYENVGEYGGNMGVILGVEKNGIWAAEATWYDVFFVIENGHGGQNTTPNQNSFYANGFLDQAEAEDFFNLSPDDLINILLLYPADKGNIQVY